MKTTFGDVVVITKHVTNSFRSRLHLGMLAGLAPYCASYTVHQRSLGAKALPPPERLTGAKCGLLVVYTSYGLPNGYLAGVKCPKILIETDYHKHLRRNTFDIYTSNKFDLIIQRGAFEPNPYLDIPMVWLPFSADAKEFYPLTKGFERRLHSIVFAGSVKADIYAQRRKAIQILAGAGLLTNIGKIKTGYPEALKQYQGGLTSTEIKSPHGKLFEMLASGTVPFTPSFIGMEQLFPGRKPFVLYKEDCSDLEDQAHAFFIDPERAASLSHAGIFSSLHKHTHARRILELVEILKAFLCGHEIPRIWGR